jgi:ankyrin repeat protein
MNYICKSEKKLINGNMVVYHIEKTLFSACEINDVAVIQSLISHITNVNQMYNGWSLLGIACYHGCFDIVETLLSHHDINVNATARVIDDQMFTA